MSRSVLVVWTAGLLLLLALGTAVARRRVLAGDALAQAQAVLRAPFGEAPELGDIDVEQAFPLLDEAEQYGADGSKVQALRSEAAALRDITRGDFSLARQGLAAWRRRSGRSVRWQWLSAELARRDVRPAGHLDTAQRKLARAIALGIGPRGRLLAGDIALDVGDGNEARKHFRLLVASHPKVAILHNRLALALEVLNDVVASEDSLRAALVLDPEMLEAWLNLGRVLQLQAQPVAAFDAFDRALTLAPTSTDALVGRALACAARSDAACATAAFRDLERAIELAPDDLLPQLALGDWHRKRGDFEAALASYRQAMRGCGDCESGEVAVGWLKLGNALVQAGQPQPALSAYENALQAEPGLGAAHNGLGAAYRALGRTAEAIREWENARELDPSDPNPVRNLARAAGVRLASR